MIKPNIQGGICHASVRNATANNKFKSLLYDSTHPTSYIMEVNDNNLKGWAMSQEMPNGDFKWISKDTCSEIELLINYANDRIAIIDLGIFNHRVTD